MTRYWLVWIDDIPVNPDSPLAWQDAVTNLKANVDRYPDRTVDLRQCAEPIPGRTMDLLCRKAMELGMSEAHLGRHDADPWIRASRVIRAVHAHLPGQRALGLREGQALGKAVVAALDSNPLKRRNEAN